MTTDILRSTLLLALLGLMASPMGCASSEGGAKKEATSSKKNADANSTKGDSSDDEVDEDDGDDKSSSSDSGGTDDASICAFLEGKSAVTRYAKDELGYLCDDGGLAKLRKAGSSQAKEFQNKENGNIFTATFAVAGTASAKGDEATSKAKAYAQLFCEDNDAFRAKYPKTFGDIEFIRTSNVKSSGCSVHTKSKDVLVIKGAEYKASQRVYVNSDKTVTLNIQYLTQAIAVTEKVVSITLTVAEKSRTRVYALQTVSADAMGFASVAVPKVKAAVENGLRDAISALD